MKKRMLLSLIMILSVLCLAACSGTNEKKTKENMEPRQEIKSDEKSLEAQNGNDSKTFNPIAVLDNNEIVKVSVRMEGEPELVTTEDKDIISDYLEAFRDLEFVYEAADTTNKSASNTCNAIIFTFSDGEEFGYNFDDYDYCYLNGTKYYLPNGDELIYPNMRIQGLGEPEYEVIADSDLAELMGIPQYTAPGIEDIVTEEDGIRHVKNQLLISADMKSELSDFTHLGEERGFDIVGYIDMTKDYQIKFRKDMSYDELKAEKEYYKTLDYVSDCFLNLASDVSAE